MAFSDKLNPNYPTRININRDYKWLKTLFRKVMKEYNYAMNKWMHTGGGSGFPEDFAGNWEEREELELFAYYAKHGSVDYLAYIMMCDKQVGFTLNAVNDPAPKNTVMENETAGSESTGKYGQGGKRSCDETRLIEQMDRMTEMIGKVMKDTVGPLIESIVGQNSKNSRKAGEQRSAMETAAKQVNGQVQVIKLINSLRDQIDYVKHSAEDEYKDTEEDEQRKSKRLKILNKIYEEAYKKLEKF